VERWRRQGGNPGRHPPALERRAIARGAWLAAARRPNPGRLNDLPQIIYKSDDAPWRRARKNLG